MYRNDLDYHAISRQVEQKLAHKKRRLQIEALIGHAVFFVTLFLVAASTKGLGGIGLLVFMAWLVGLLLHTGATFVSLGRRDLQLREQLLQRAIQDAILRLGRDDLADSYGTAMHLSNDGELIELDEGYPEDEKPKRETL